MSTQLPLPYFRPVKNERRVCDLPAEDRPLYRLQQVGASALSTSELLALVLGAPRGPGMAERLLSRFGSLHQLARAGKAQLLQVHGIGEAQAGRLLAVLELSRRLQAPPADEKLRITCPADGARLLLPLLRHLEQEELHVILLDTRNQVLDVCAVYRGSLNTSMVRLAEIFRPAIEAPAAALIMAHNHPSGDPAPSPDDLQVTRQAVQAGALLDVSVLDHLIIGNGVYTSLKERGLGFD